MIPINKEEAMALRENVKNVHIVRTMKKKSKRKHYFCEESKRAMAFLEAMRNGRENNKKAGGENKYSKKP